MHQAQLSRSSVIQVLVVLFLSVLGTAPAQATELPIEGGPGGGSFRALCKGQHLVGVSIKSGTWVDAIFPLCAPFLSGESRFGRWTRGTRHGGQGGSRLLRDGFCPRDRFVSGIRFGWTRKDRDAEFIDYVELTCSSIASPPLCPACGPPPIKVCLQTGDGCWDDHPNRPRGVFYRPFGPWPPFEQACPAGEAAVGIRGRSGIYVDALGLICGPKPVVSVATPPPKPIKPLGKRPKIVTAKNDVDVYDSPVIPRRVIAMMAGGTQSKFLEYHSDGWCKLDIPTPKVIGWVAQDHLTGCP